MAERRHLRARGLVPVEAKFRPAVRGEHLVPRGELVDRLLESRDHPVVLVAAPAGYGKSVLVSQWAAQDPRPFAWLAVDAADDDPTVLLTYLLLALHRVEAVDASVLAAATEPSREPEGVLHELGTLLRGRQQPFVLVLDGADCLASPGAVRVLSTLAEDVPRGSQVVLVARQAPPLDWTALRDRGRLLQLGVADLRLSRVEARALLASVGAQQSDAQVDALLDRTEGWAVGVYLAALALAKADPATDVEAAVDSNSLVADYLREEVLSGLGRDDRDFLLRTSLVPVLTGELCDALLQTTGSQQRLARLADSNVLRSPRAPGEGYGVHRLLRDLLRAELQRREPALVHPLHGRASRWFEAHGQPAEAIAAALAAGDLQRASRLIWSETPRRLATGQLPVLQEWLARLSSRQVTAQAELALTAAWCAVQTGQDAEHWLVAAERGQYDAARKGRTSAMAGAAALLRATLARHGLVQMGADAQLALGLLEPDDPWACSAGVLDAVSTYLTGHTEEARSRLQAAERLAAAAGAHDARALALGELAVLALDDDPTAAPALADTGSRLVREHGIEGLATLMPVRCVSTMLAVQDRGGPEAAERVQQDVRQLAVAGPPAAWAVVQCRQLLARAQLLLGDPAAARAVLSDAQPLLASVPDSPVLRSSTERTWRQIEQLPLQGSLGSSALTSAELRILQYLPTHLSFEEIGRELFVSRNTVKTQAMAAYRKLGVTSRGEAVERAWALGLIPR